MARPKKIEDQFRVSVVLSKKQAERIQHIAIRIRSQGGRQVTVSEAIRMAIEATYPLPKNKLNIKI